MAAIAPQSGKPGERVVAYIDHVGRLEGTIARIDPNGFSTTISASPRKRDKLAAQLTWLANRSSLDLPDAAANIGPKSPIQTLSRTPSPDSKYSFSAVDRTAGRFWSAFAFDTTAAPRPRTVKAMRRPPGKPVACVVFPG
jgi:hypothetical protein